MEAAPGFEPGNGGFANRCLGPLGYAAEPLLSHQKGKPLLG